MSHPKRFDKFLKRGCTIYKCRVEQDGKWRNIYYLLPTNIGKSEDIKVPSARYSDDERDIVYLYIECENDVWSKAGNTLGYVKGSSSFEIVEKYSVGDLAKDCKCCCKCGVCDVD